MNTVANMKPVRSRLKTFKVQDSLASSLFSFMLLFSVGSYFYSNPQTSIWFAVVAYGAAVLFLCFGLIILIINSLNLSRVEDKTLNKSALVELIDKASFAITPIVEGIFCPLFIYTSAKALFGGIGGNSFSIWMLWVMFIVPVTILAIRIYSYVLLYKERKR